MSCFPLVLPLFVLSTLLAPAPATAHDPGLSSALVQIGAEAVTAYLKVNDADLDGSPIDAAALRIEIDGRTAGVLSVEPLAGAPGHSEARLRYSRPDGSRLRVTSAVLAELPFGHKQHLRIQGDGGHVRTDRILSAEAPSFEIELQSPAPTGTPAAAAGFLALGIEHIATGHDHLLFLLALLVVCRGLRPVIRIITAFTAAHSITLAAGTLGWVAVPSGVVEPLIAASIVVVAGLNLLGVGGAHERLALAFGFGLVHGLGFAGLLVELGIGGSGMAAAFPLAAFNVGVEAGQIAIAALVLPVLGWLRRTPALARAVGPACSALVGALGMAWLIERTLPV